MKPNRAIPAACLAALFCAGCSTVDIKKYPDPHQHKIRVHQERPSKYHIGDMEAHAPREMILRKPPADQALFNKTRTMSICIAETTHGLFGYVVPILYLWRKDQPAVVFVSRTWPGRALSGVTWLDDRLIAFDLMAGADLGWHYVIDAQEGRSIFAGAFVDR